MWQSRNSNPVCRTPADAENEIMMHLFCPCSGCGFAQWGPNTPSSLRTTSLKLLRPSKSREEPWSLPRSQCGLAGLLATYGRVDRETRSPVIEKSEWQHALISFSVLASDSVIRNNVPMDSSSLMDWGDMNRQHWRKQREPVSGQCPSCSSGHSKAEISKWRRMNPLCSQRGAATPHIWRPSWQSSPQLSFPFVFKSCKPTPAGGPDLSFPREGEQADFRLFSAQMKESRGDRQEEVQCG